MCGARRCSTRPTNNSSSEATWLQFVTRWTRPPKNPVWCGKFAGPVRGVAGPAVPRWGLFAGDGRRLAPNGTGANAWPEVFRVRKSDFVAFLRLRWRTRAQVLGLHPSPRAAEGR